jgi:hypothetical protein
MKRLIAIAVAAMAVACTGAENVATNGTVSRKGTLKRIYDEKFGGLIVQPGSRKGCIGFLNAQGKVDKDEITKVVKNLHRLLKQDMRVADASVKGLPTRKDVEKAGVSLAVFAVDDAALPALLAAPEERWALVNVAKLGEGLPKGAAGNVLLTTRFRAEMMRAFSLVAGGASSQYPNNIHAATELAQLDAMDADALTMDVILRCQNHLQKDLNVMPERVVTYRRARQEGWAPAPTNDVQKAIWDKVHEMPSAPIKIKPEVKKVTE